MGVVPSASLFSIMIDCRCSLENSLLAGFGVAGRGTVLPQLLTYQPVQEHSRSMVRIESAVLGGFGLFKGQCQNHFPFLCGTCLDWLFHLLSSELEKFPVVQCQRQTLRHLLSGLCGGSTAWKAKQAAAGIEALKSHLI